MRPITRPRLVHFVFRRSPARIGFLNRRARRHARSPAAHEATNEIKGKFRGKLTRNSPSPLVPSPQAWRAPRRRTRSRRRSPSALRVTTDHFRGFRGAARGLGRRRRPSPSRASSTQLALWKGLRFDDSHFLSSQNHTCKEGVGGKNTGERPPRARPGRSRTETWFDGCPGKSTMRATAVVAHTRTPEGTAREGGSKRGD